MTTITKLLMRHWAKQYNCGFKICSVFLNFFLFSMNWLYLPLPSPSLNPPPLPLSRSLWTQPWPILLNIIFMMICWSYCSLCYSNAWGIFDNHIDIAKKKETKRKRLSANSGKLESNIFIKAIGFVNHMRRHFKTWFMNSMYACIF